MSLYNSGMDKTQVELAWAAGFFDGEGSISIRKNKAGAFGRMNDSYILSIGACQTIEAPIVRFKDMFGGAVRLEQRDGLHNIYRWQAGSKDAHYALKLMLPYLCVKREQALIAIEFQERRKEHWSRRDLVVDRFIDSLDRTLVLELNSAA